MQGLHSGENIAGNGVDVITGTGTGTSIMFTGVDHIHTSHGYMSSVSPPTQLPQKCPRCDSTNTKFCYYNNYNLSQPRHFCKACRRYWTKGGVLRNVPVGGGCRRSKQSSGSKSSKSTSNKNCKRTTAASRSTSDTSTVTSVDHTNTDPGLIFGETCGTELPSQIIAPSMHDLEFSLPDPMHSQIQNESKETIDKSKIEECSVLPEIFNQTAEADLLPVFQAQFVNDSIHAFPGHDWSLSVDQALFDLSTGIGETGSIWNQHNWGDATADPALYLP